MIRGSLKQRLGGHSAICCTTSRSASHALFIAPGIAAGIIRFAIVDGSHLPVVRDHSRLAPPSFPTCPSPPSLGSCQFCVATPKCDIVRRMESGR
jgi:hypothetical protein